MHQLYLMLWTGLCLFMASQSRAQCPETFNIPDIYIKKEITNNDPPWLGNIEFSSCRTYLIHETVTFHFPENAFTAAIQPNNQTYEFILRADLADGNGYQAIPDDLKMSVTYTTPARRTIRLQACAGGGSGQCYNYWDFPLVHNPVTASYMQPDMSVAITTDSVWTPPCTTAYGPASPFLSSMIGGAQAYIKYGEGHSQLVKPLIFVDGLDFGSSEKVVVDPALAGDGIIRYGRNGWDALVRGSYEGYLDFTNGDVSEFALYPAQFDDLLAAGFDIVFLDFQNGSDYIQKNGYLLMELLRRINDEWKVDDPTTGIRHENVIVGASMGGQIARWALARMEQHGQAHCTGTYLSFDSPQQGANIPLSLQATAWFFSRTGQDTRLWTQLNDPAPRQLLLDNFEAIYNDRKIKALPWTVGTATYQPDSTRDYRCLRELYVAEMAELGYPTTTRNIAIACGSELGVGQGYGEGASQFNAHLFANEHDFGSIFRMGLWSQNGGTANYVVRGMNNCFKYFNNLDQSEIVFAAATPHDFNPCVEGVIQGRSPHRYHSVYVQMLDTLPPFDNAPGCYRNDLLALRHDLSTRLEELVGSENVDVDIDVIDDRERSSFMPLISTLDIDWPLDREHLWKNVAAEDILQNDLTPFEYYYAPKVNLKHVEMDSAMREWVNTELALSEINLTPVLATGSSYNFANPYRRRLPTVTVSGESTLRVNGPGFSGYGDEVASTQETFIAHTSDCGSYITVENGGKLILGNDNAALDLTRRAYVHIQSGSTVEIKSGGKLRLARGSRLIIEPGAQLIIEPGAEIDLWWGDSYIEVQGELVYRGTFDFSGSGYFLLQNTHTLTMEAPALEITGQAGDHFLRLGEKTVLDVGSHDLILKDGGVEYSSNASIKVTAGAKIELENMRLTGLGDFYDEHIGLDIEGVDELRLFGVEVERLGIGVWLRDALSATLTRIYFTDFTDCLYGLLVTCANVMDLQDITFNSSAPSAFAFYAEDVEWLGMGRVTIEQYQAIGGESAFKLKEVNVASFSGVTLRNNGIGVELRDVPELRIFGGSTENNGIGIQVPQIGEADGKNESNILLFRKAVVSNNTTGIQIDRGGENPDGSLYGMVLMDCAELSNNGKGITGTDVTLQIDAYLNAGTNDPALIRPNQIYGGGVYFDICYDQLAPSVSTVLARGNYWGGGEPSLFSYKVNTPATDCVTFGGILDTSLPVDVFTVCDDDELAEPYPDGGGVIVISDENPDGFTEDECELIYSSSTPTAVHEVWFDAWRLYRAGQTGIAKVQFADLAAINALTHQQASASCQHYIKVAKALTHGTATLQSEQEIPQKASTLRLIPNPTKESFIITSSTIGQGMIKVYNATGQLIHEQTYQSGTWVSTTAWESGWYVLRLYSPETGTQETQRLIVQH